MENKNRIAYWDIAKGIGICAVVVGHYLGIWFLPALIWSFHMPLFVFVSGYFYKAIPFRQRVKKAFRAYMIPYFLTWAALIVFEIILNLCGVIDGTVSETVARRLLSGVFALASDSTPNIPAYVIKIGVLWFLNALFVGTVFFALLLKLKKRIRQLLCIAGAYCTAILLTRYFCVPLGLQYGAAFTLWLWIGYQYRQNAGGRVVAAIQSGWGTAVSFVVWIGVVAISHVTGKTFNICFLQFPLYGLEIIGALCGINSVIFISRSLEKIRWLSAILTYVGKRTLWILCFHAMSNELLHYFAIPMSVRVVMDIVLGLAAEKVWHMIQAKRIKHTDSKEIKV